MIHLAYAYNDRELSGGEWDALSADLPEDLRRDCDRYRRWQDRQAGLFGKLLLREVGRRVLDRTPGLHRFRRDDHRRPYLADQPDFDFNISHTAGLVVCCGAAGAGRLGVDVERVGEIDVREFRRVFTAEEYQRLERLADPTAEFYRLWTRKEAVMKADGRGFALDPAGIDCLPDRVRVGGPDYAVRPLDLRAGFAAHVACREACGVKARAVSYGAE